MTPTNKRRTENSSELWPEELTFDKIRAIPSLHYLPEFARLVRQQIREFKPDVVALELPDLYDPLIRRAVGFLPELSSIITPGDEIIPISPEDSIIEGIRSATEMNIDIACVDLEISVDKEHIHEGRNFTLDSALLEKISIIDFINLNADKISDTTENTAFLMREEHMASRLQQLSQKYSRILFICGMVHWQRIKTRLSQHNSSFKHRFSKSGAIACINPLNLFKLVGTIPFRAGCYEKTRNSPDFNLQSWMTELFNAAAESCDQKINAPDLQALLKFTRNLAILPGGLSPSPNTLALGGAGIIDRPYGDAVMKKVFEYPFAGSPSGITLEICCTQGFYLQTGRGKMPLQPYHFSSTADSAGFGDSTALAQDKRLSGRKHPNTDFINKHPGKCFSDAWGRYADEMDEEERFISTLERWAYHSISSDDEYVSLEFCDGLLDGIDVRETIRDLVHDRLFIKEYQNIAPQFSAVLVEFSDNQREFAAPMYTYGRHKALAFSTPDIPNPANPGTASREFGQLLSFKRLIRNEQLWDLFDHMIELQNLGYDTQRAILAAALQVCNPEEILIVAPPDSISRCRKILTELKPGHQKGFTSLNHDKIWNQACERIRRFNIYYYF